MAKKKSHDLLFAVLHWNSNIVLQNFHFNEFIKHMWEQQNTVHDDFKIALTLAFQPENIVFNESISFWCKFKSSSCDFAKSKQNTEAVPKINDLSKTRTCNHVNYQPLQHLLILISYVEYVSILQRKYAFEIQWWIHKFCARMRLN